MTFIGNNPRAQTKVRGITFEQLYRLFLARAEHIRPNTDLDASAQAFCCEIEKAMGIYPNTGGK